MNGAALEARVRRGTYLLLIWGDNCPPCKALKPRLRQVAGEHHLDLQEINAGDRPDLVRRLGLRSVPAVYAANEEGAERALFTGLKTETEITELLRETGHIA